MRSKGQQSLKGLPPTIKLANQQTTSAFNQQLAQSKRSMQKQRERAYQLTPFYIADSQPAPPKQAKKGEKPKNIVGPNMSFVCPRCYSTCVICEKADDNWKFSCFSCGHTWYKAEPLPEEQHR
ncbi:MAG: hypothetical protein DRJ31_07950 [Candidatus Methanomethylicota archaeon]|uniref:Uncharacterized protein n=1 Tax=Thermoproteota archaeon TaxID=2056631 RepID=A0A497EMM4_9CREN|nr:MAG: hypothetical protein DRJ31_07950 [Candidatus Verstraetearchaeota archaeon]